MTIKKYPIALLATVFVAACASNQLPRQQLLDTNAAMDSASEVDNGSTASVDLHIKYAEDQIEIARQLMEDGKEERAYRMLDRAQADAELALAMAKTARSRDAAQAAWNDIEELDNR